MYMVCISTVIQVAVMFFMLSMEYIKTVSALKGVFNKDDFINTWGSWQVTTKLQITHVSELLLCISLLRVVWMFF